jgi:hypothetical protein
VICSLLLTPFSLTPFALTPFSFTPFSSRLQLFDKYINTCPTQGTRRTPRTEETVLISLAALRQPIARSNGSGAFGSGIVSELAARANAITSNGGGGTSTSTSTSRVVAPVRHLVPLNSGMGVDSM